MTINIDSDEDGLTIATLADYKSNNEYKSIVNTLTTMGYILNKYLFQWSNNEINILKECIYPHATIKTLKDTLILYNNKILKEEIYIPRTIKSIYHLIINNFKGNNRSITNNNMINTNNYDNIPPTEEEILFLKYQVEYKSDTYNNIHKKYNKIFGQYNMNRSIQSIRNIYIKYQKISVKYQYNSKIKHEKYFINLSKKKKYIKKKKKN